MRLFIAIEIPEEIKEYISTIQNQLSYNYSKIKPVTKQQMHLTLKFLGEVQPNKAKETIEALKQIKFKKFNFNLDSVGIFPNKSNIRVVWLGLKPEEDIINLQKEIDDKLERLFDKDRDFKPHITLCRVKHIENKNAFIEKIKNLRIESKNIDVSSFKLIKSTLTKNGPVYEELCIFAGD